MFVRKENIDENKTYQGYLEPKGGHLLEEDAWKEKFLLEIENNHTVSGLFSDGYEIMGLPFFNKDKRADEFEKAVDSWMESV